MLDAIGNASKTFLSWWTSELQNLVAVRAGASIRQGPRLLVHVEQNGFRLEHSLSGRASHSSDAFFATARELETAVAGLLDVTPRPTVELRIPAGACFMRTVRLPRAAQRDLPQLLALDLERATPFKPADIFTGYIVDQGADQGPTLSVRQYVLKRRTIADAAGAVERAGASISAISCVDTDGAGLAYFRPADLTATPHAGPPRASMTTLLAVMILLLGGSAAYLAVNRHDVALAEIKASTDGLKREATEIRERMTAAQALDAEVAAFNRLRRRTISRALIIEEVTRVLPDSDWLTELRIEAATVDLSGLAQSGNALVPLFETSDLFVDATLTAPVTFDQALAKERFSLRVQLRNVASGPADQKPEVAP